MNSNINEKDAQQALEKGYDKAKIILQDEDKLDNLFREMERKLKVVPNIGEGLSHIPVFASMVNSYVKKEYTKVPLGTIIAMISAIAYFVSPIDIVPDVIPGAGLIDDAFVVAACLALVDSDVKDYIVWRDSRNN